MRVLTFLALAFLWAAPSFAQTPFETLVSFRQQYPAVMTPAQVGELLNRVAWTYRADGMKLLGKNGGANCPTPTGILISCDYLVHSASLTGHDVLSGRDDGTIAVVGFTWGPGPEDLAGAIRGGARSLVDPVLPDSTAGPGPGVPSPVVTPPGPVAPTVTVFDTKSLELLIKDLQQRLIDLQRSQNDNEARAETFRQAVGHEWATFGKFIGKYGPIVAGALLGGKYLFSNTAAAQ